MPQALYVGAARDEAVHRGQANAIRFLHAELRRRGSPARFGERHAKHPRPDAIRQSRPPGWAPRAEKSTCASAPALGVELLLAQGVLHPLFDVPPMRSTLLCPSHPKSQLAVVERPPKICLVLVLNGPFNAPQFLEASHLHGDGRFSARLSGTLVQTDPTASDNINHVESDSIRFGCNRQRVTNR